jgi:preprotein translocase subunit YajC
MKMEKATRDQITKNVILSLFIYILPVAAMFVTFWITGERPWEKKAQKVEKVKPSTIKNLQNNGSND